MHKGLMVGALATALLLAGCGGEPGGDGMPTGDASNVAADVELSRLLGFLTGSFSSATQAAADSAYFDIRLKMVRIWPERRDGAWLYVEQAAASALERPYRQRVYHLTRFDAERFESAVFTLPDALSYAGAWRTPDSFAELTPEDLGLREGCSILLRRGEEGVFRGSTQGEGCASSLRGAAYAMSEVVLQPDRLTSWDRGFDAEGTQVWGAEKGPYVFDRVQP